MRKKSKAGDGRKSQRADSRGACGKRKTSAGEKINDAFESGAAGNGCSDATHQPESPTGKDGKPAAGASRSVDLRALRRILTWLLETSTEQQSLILSAMDIVSGPQEGSAIPNERSVSPGALLRATLAERTAARLHPPSPSS